MSRYTHTPDGWYVNESGDKRAFGDYVNVTDTESGSALGLGIFWGDTTQTNYGALPSETLTLSDLTDEQRAALTAHVRRTIIDNPHSDFNTPSFGPGRIGDR